MPELPLWLVADPDGSNPMLVRAEDQRAAVEELKGKRNSVGALKRGVIFAVWRLGNFPEQFHVAYDKEPLTESHGATNAKLVIRELGRPRV